MEATQIPQEENVEEDDLANIGAYIEGRPLIH